MAGHLTSRLILLASSTVIRHPPPSTAPEPHHLGGFGFPRCQVISTSLCNWLGLRPEVARSLVPGLLPRVYLLTVVSSQKHRITPQTSPTRPSPSSHSGVYYSTHLPGDCGAVYRPQSVYLAVAIYGVPASHVLPFWIPTPPPTGAVEPDLTYLRSERGTCEHEDDCNSSSTGLLMTSAHFHTITATITSCDVSIPTLPLVTDPSEHADTDAY